MATKKPTENGDAGIQIKQVKTETINVWVCGTSPLILNSQSEKARHELLLPRPRPSRAGRSPLKHDVYQEFRSAPYLFSDPATPTLLALPFGAFKGAMMTASIDASDSNKSQIGRLVWVNGEYVPIFGKPQLLMSMVRQAGKERTPDVRTRAIVPQWAAALSITFVTPTINATSVANLLTAGGLLSGVGDWRPEKGKGNYGQFRVVEPGDPLLTPILQQDRAVQAAAMNDPEPYDIETEKLLSWFTEEVRARGLRATGITDYASILEPMLVGAGGEDEFGDDEDEEEGDDYDASPNGR